jgi:hypothetical protein
MNPGKFDTLGRSYRSPGHWPTWARVTVTLAVLIHAWAIWIGAWSSPPSSPLERSLADGFHGYYGLVDQGYAYRYYVDPPPTPVVTATVRYADGRSEEVRLPNRATRPRMLYQRELALANSLFLEVDESRQHRGDPGHGPWAQSYARHLGKTHPGAKTVTLSVQLHLIPEPARVAEELRVTGKAPDLDAEEFYTVPERIGEYPCDAS